MLKESLHFQQHTEPMAISLHVVVSPFTPQALMLAIQQGPPTAPFLHRAGAQMSPDHKKGSYSPFSDIC